MLDFLAVCIAIFFLIQASEYLFKKKYIGSETSRKLIHMGTGVIVAFTPYFLEWREIQLLSIAFLLVIGVSSKFRVFRSIHSVKRITKGEILYPIGIGICAFLEPANWIFTAAILHLAIADALAAVVGLKWGKRTKYMLLSHGKSMLGSMTFFYVSMAIMFSAYLFVEPENLPDTFLLLIVAPAILTLLENISWYGSDNVTIPVMAIVLLSGLPG